MISFEFHSKNHIYLRFTFYTIAILMMTNLSAVVDAVFHPDIPYFHEEHLIIGAFTGMLTFLLIVTFHVYTRRLERAFDKISKLENILSICSNCKKIRIGERSSTSMDAWQNIDMFFAEMTTVQFSHGICPECAQKLYREIDSSVE